MAQSVSSLLHHVVAGDGTQISRRCLYLLGLSSSWPSLRFPYGVLALLWCQGSASPCSEFETFPHVVFRSA